ncbi:MAG: hypothetical protein BWK79_09620, partial [Beggiatoa sp. IS2]
IIDLAGVLGRFEPAIPGQIGAVKLTTDVLVNNAVNGILGAINGLYDVNRENIVITQNSVTGYLEADIGKIHCAVLPAQTRQVLRNQIDHSIPLGMSVDNDHSVTFITHTGREVLTYPVVQDFAALQEQLQQRGLGEVIVESNGNLKIPLTTESFFNAQPSLCAVAVSNETPLGLTGTMPVSTVFMDAQGQRRQQFFYPAVADTASLARRKGGYRQEASYITIVGQEQTYEGMLDYLVTLGQSPTGNAMQVLETEDMNGDGLRDYQIVYPQGVTQRIFRLP